MNGRKAKKIREEAYIYTRGVDKLQYDPKRVNFLMKDIYKHTPRNIRHKFFGE